MKLRIQDNSVRFRLTRGEVEQLQETGGVRASVHFPGGRSLDYSLETTDGATRPEARFADRRISVILPRASVNDWASTEQVAIVADESLEPNGQLAILVEKDFQCLAPREGVDESDLFPHPRKGQEIC